MIWGLVAALGWGSADVLGAVTGRRIGSLRTATLAQSVSLVAVWVAILAVGPSLSISGPQLAALAGSGILAGFAYLCLYRALELGPVALVTPIVAAFAAVTIVLAILLFHEHIGVVGGLGAGAALIGVVLASTDIQEVRKGAIAHLQRGGIPWALGAMLCFGLGALFLGKVAQSIDPLTATAYARSFNVATILVVTAIRSPSLRGLPKVDAASYRLVTVVGLTDVIGTLSFAYGASVAKVSLVAAASVALVVLPLGAGLLFFGERPRVAQYVGIAVVVAGLMTLSLAA